jgi:hypothetical protein
MDSKIENSLEFYKNFTKNYVRVERFHELFEEIPQIV